MLTRTIICSSEFASDYIELLEGLKMQRNHRSALSSVKRCAAICVGETNKSAKAMDEFREALGDAVNQITTVMKDSTSSFGHIS